MTLKNDNKRLQFIYLSLTRAINYYRLISSIHFSINQLIIIYQIGIISETGKTGSARLLYLSDKQYISQQNTQTSLIRLVNKGILKKDRFNYTLSPAGWIHYNALYSLFERYYSIQGINYQKAKQGIKKSK